MNWPFERCRKKKWPPPFKVPNNSTFQYWVYFRVIRPGGFIFGSRVLCLKYLRFFNGQKEEGVATVYASTHVCTSGNPELYIFGRKRSLIMKPASLTAAKAFQIRPTINYLQRLTHKQHQLSNARSFSSFDLWKMSLGKHGIPKIKTSVYSLYLKLCPWLKRWKQENVYSPITTWKKPLNGKV